MEAFLLLCAFIEDHPPFPKHTQIRPNKHPCWTSLVLRPVQIIFHKANVKHGCYELFELSRRFLAKELPNSSNMVLASQKIKIKKKNILFKHRQVKLNDYLCLEPMAWPPKHPQSFVCAHLSPGTNSSSKFSCRSIGGVTPGRYCRCRCCQWTHCRRMNRKHISEVSA